MANKKKSENITIANVIAIVGLVLLLVFTFIGHSFMSGGEIGWDIIISVGVTALSGFLLWFMIKAKGAENELDKWKKVEYATLGLYILIAIPVSIYGGAMHFFVVNDNKENIKECARRDLNKIDKLFEEYSSFENEAILITEEGLKNAFWNELSPNLDDFVREHNISRDERGAETYGSNQKDKLFNKGYDNLLNHWKNRKDTIHTTVDSWAVIQIPAQAKAIEEEAEYIQTKLTEMSGSATLPYIKEGRIENENQTKTYTIEGGIDSLEFKKAMTEANGFSVLAIFVILLIHLLILFNYVVAHRTSVLQVSKHKENDGGIILN